jgi:hypothetical protein
MSSSYAVEGRQGARLWRRQPVVSEEDGVVDQLGFGVEDLLAGVDLGQR